MRLWIENKIFDHLKITHINFYVNRPPITSASEAHRSVVRIRSIYLRLHPALHAFVHPQTAIWLRRHPSLGLGSQPALDLLLEPEDGVPLVLS